MSSNEEQREPDKILEQDMKGQVKEVLIKALENKLACNEPWIGWIVKGFYTCIYIRPFEPDIRKRWDDGLYWPDISEKDIRRYLEELGYVISKVTLSVSVPKQKKGQACTFAREWANKINKNYRNYFKRQKRKAIKYYNENMKTLCSLKAKDVRLEGHGYYSITLIGSDNFFCDVFEKQVRKLFAKDGIIVKPNYCHDSPETEFLIPKDKVKF